MAALLTAADGIGCLAAARALHARGIPVVAVGPPGSLAFASRAVGRALIAPSSRSEPEAFAQFVLQAVGAHSVKLVIPFDDTSCVALDGLRQQLERTTRLALPSAACLGVALDKERLAQAAARSGVVTPRTHVVRTLDEARAAASSVGYPLVVKPRASALGREIPAHLRFKVRFVEGWPSLQNLLGPYLAEGRSLLLQEYCPGRLMNLDGFCADGKILALTQMRSGRTFERTGRLSLVREMVPLDPDLEEQVARLLGDMGFDGLFNVQFLRGAQDGAWRLIDLNPRASIFLGTVVRAGVDTPYLAYAWYTGGQVVPVGSYRIGVRGRNLRMDVRHLVQSLRGEGCGIDPHCPNRRRALTDFLWEFLRADHYDAFALRDPLPSLTGPLGRGWRGGKRAARRFLGRLGLHPPLPSSVP